MTVADIDNSCPYELEPYEKAYIKSLEREDIVAWLHGQYTYEALGVILQNAFAKRGQKLEKYPEEPHSQHEQVREMTKEELNSLSAEEQEKVIMQAWENAMADTVESFNRMKAEQTESGKDE